MAKVAAAKPPVSQAAPSPAVASAKLTAKTPPALKPEDASLKEKFLTAKNAQKLLQDDGPVRENIPATSNIKPLATPNGEVVNTPAPVASVVSVPKQETRRATPPTPAPTEYTLSTGDNLYAVSRRFQVSYNDLMVANGITDPRQLRSGQKLKLPERKTDSTCAL